MDADLRRSYLNAQLWPYQASEAPLQAVLIVMFGMLCLLLRVLDDIMIACVLVEAPSERIVGWAQHVGA